MSKPLTSFSAHFEGTALESKVKSVDLPTIAEETQDYRGFGMGAPVKVAVGMQAMETVITLGELSASMLSAYGIDQGKNVGLVIRGAVGGGSAIDAVVVSLRGRITQVEFGTWQDGEMAETSITLDTRYIKLTKAGQVALEIDIENNVKNIGGKNLLETVQTALGR